MNNENKDIASNALNWLSSNIENFNPLDNSNISKDLRHQSFTELALLSHYISRNKQFKNDQRVEDFLNFITRIYKMPFFQNTIHHDLVAFVPHTLIAVVLKLMNKYYDPYTWNSIQQIILKSHVCNQERIPYRMLELWHLLELGGFSHTMASVDKICSMGIFSIRPNLAYLTDDDAYAITHTIFYLSDFGAKDIEGLTEVQLEYATWVIPKLLCIYIRKCNWDIAAELLISAHCLQCNVNHYEDIAWAKIKINQLESGAIIGPYFDMSKAKKLSKNEYNDYEFTNCYHTTLVNVLALTLCNTQDHEYESRN